MGDFVKILGYLVLVVAVLAIIPLVVMLLWNWLMPYLFGVPTVDFWKALGILVLCSCLFWKPSSKN